MTMPSTVRTDRSLFAQSCSRALRTLARISMRSPPRSVAARPVRLDPAVAEPDDPPAPGGDVGLVGHEDDRLPLGVQVVEEVEDLLLVRVSRLPVGSSARIKRRPLDQRPGDGDPLPLAARTSGSAGARSGRPGRPAAAPRPPGRGGRGPRSRSAAARRSAGPSASAAARRSGRRSRSAGPARGPAPTARAAATSRPASQYCPLGRHVEQPEDVHQGRLARPRRPHDRHEFIGVDREVDAVEGADLLDAHPVGLGDAAPGGSRARRRGWRVTGSGPSRRGRSRRSGRRPSARRGSGRGRR